jgi:hypothetical protein
MQVAFFPVQGGLSAIFSSCRPRACNHLVLGLSFSQVPQAGAGAAKSEDFSIVQEFSIIQEIAFTLQTLSAGT